MLPYLPSSTRLAAWCLALLCLAALPRPDAAASPGGQGGTRAEDRLYWLEIHKQRQVLHIMNGDGPLRSYHVAIGKGQPGTKHRRGDRKTPEGVYRIMESRPSLRFHRFLQLNYPNRMDAWLGLAAGLISPTQYQAIMQAHREHRLPPQDTGLGGQIGLHGTGQLEKLRPNWHRLFNWTQGCIAVTNREIEDLDDYLREGTRVVIYP